MKDALGHGLHQVQAGIHPVGAKLMRGEFRGIGELIDDHRGNTYRLIYTTKFGDVIYVLHAFQMKSRRGVSTPRNEVRLIKSRFARVAATHRGATELPAGEE